MQRLSCLLLLCLAAFTQGIAAVTIRVGRYPAFTGPVVEYEDAILARLKISTGYTVTTVNLGSLTERITALQNSQVDAVIAQFTVTESRKLNVTFVNPYHFGDGAALFAKDINASFYLGLVVNSPNPAVAYAGFSGLTFCNEVGSAYNEPVKALGLKLKQKTSQAAINNDPACQLTSTDSTATLAGFTKIPGPLVAGTAAAQAVAVPLKTAANANKAVRVALTEALVALYVGTPGKTTIENLNKNILVKAVPPLKGATAPLANGAKFMNNFFV